MEELERGALGLLQGGPGAEVVMAGGGEGGGEGDEVVYVVDGVVGWGVAGMVVGVLVGMGLVRHGFGFGFGGWWMVTGKLEDGVIGEFRKMAGKCFSAD